MQPIKILTANIDKPNSTSIDVYIDGGGYKAIETALKMKPEEVPQLVKDSEMRGRGGAGFPTGMKWSFVPRTAPKPIWLLCNSNEYDPCTLEDRVIIDEMPHLRLRGEIISIHAIGSNSI